MSRASRLYRSLMSVGTSDAFCASSRAQVPLTNMFLPLMLVLTATAVYAEVPDFIHVCKRSDPKVEQCVLNSIDEIRPRLKAGIPELKVPPLEPLHVDEVEIANGQDATRLRIYGRDIVVRGGSDFIVNKLKLDLSTDSRPTFHVDLTLPGLDLDGDYELTAKLLLLPLNGRGKIHVNATRIHADAVIYGQLYKKGTKNYLRFTKVDMDLKMDDFDIKLNHLFNGDPTLSEVANRIIKENKDEFGKTLNPIIARTVSKVLLDISNKITVHNPYDDLFPLN